MAVEYDVRFRNRKAEERRGGRLLRLALVTASASLGAFNMTIATQASAGLMATDHTGGRVLAILLVATALASGALGGAVLPTLFWSARRAGVRSRGKGSRGSHCGDDPAGSLPVTASDPV